MAKGKQTGTSASAELLAKDEYRGYVVIMHQNATPVAIAVMGETAVIDEGVILTEIGDSVSLSGAQARGQVNIIGNGGTVTYQTGLVSVRLNGYLT